MEFTLTLEVWELNETEAEFRFSIHRGEVYIEDMKLLNKRFSGEETREFLGQSEFDRLLECGREHYAENSAQMWRDHNQTFAAE